MRNYFILDGVDSRDFGVYISGQGTFSAPQKAYQFYNIPGRNGALLGNEHRLENINVSYEAFIYTNFDANLAAFRSFLLSLNGYTRLTDSYHPDEYRLAVYQGPFSPKVTKMNNAGSFTITFSCKPQRFLLSGESKYSWAAGGAQTLTGESLSVYSPMLDTTFLKASVDLQASGYVNAVEILINGETVKTVSLGSGVTNAATLDLIAGTGTRTRKYMKLNDTFTKITTYSEVVFKSSGTMSSLLAGTISYIAPPFFYVSPGSSEANTVSKMISALAQNHTKVWSKYNGYLYIIDVPNSSKTGSEYGTYFKDIGLAVLLSTAESFTFSPYVPDFPDGIFELSAFAYAGSAKATVSAKYLPNSSMSNPTPFPSSPLIRAYGNGSFTMDGVTVTITSASSYTDIDCDLMDCYEGSTNRNNDVSFSTYDFPQLQPGDNQITIVTGITAVEITPRWWRL